jgi:putative inorganic carbon (hco3(-)) transporter
VNYRGLASAGADMIDRDLAKVMELVLKSSLERYIRWLLYATVACLPLYVVRWHYGPLPTTLLETLIVITAALYVFVRWREGVRRPVATPYDIPIVLLLIAGAIAVVVAGDHRGALGLYRAYFVEPVAIFYVAVDVLKRADHRLNLVMAFAVGSSVFAALNIGAFVKALAAHNVNVGFAPTALYDDANPVAMYLEPPFALAAGLLFFATTSRLKLIGLVWLACVGSALMVTFSKGAYLGLAGLVIVAIVTVPRWRLPLLGALVAAAVIATQISLVYQRLVTVIPSLQGREQIFGAAVDMIRAHPLLGVGLGGFSYKFRGLTPEIYPHDMWLTFWVEIGLLGVVAFAVIFLMLQWTGWRAWPGAARADRAVIWGVLGGLVLWLIHGLVDSPYWKNDMSAEFWFMAALLLATLRGAYNATKPVEEKAQAA